MDANDDAKLTKLVFPVSADSPPLAPAPTVPSTSPTEPASSSPSLTGFELVADMMRRQDAVIAEIDELNGRIEAAIESLSAARKAEIDTLESEPSLETTTTPLKKAA